ncbi:MAG: dockerin type I domain-containing protein [Dehalococcoidia bacterium]
MRRLVFAIAISTLVAPLLLGGHSSARAGAPAAIAFASDRDDDFYEIYSMAADGSNVTRLTNNPAFDEHPAWSPDGKQIIFDSDRGGQRQVWLMDADGGNARRVSAEGAFGSYPAWSPDGERIAYLGGNDVDENIDVYVMDLDGSNVERLTDDPAWDGAPAWAPNNELIAFVSERDGNREIYVMNADGSNETNITHFPGNDSEPDWIPNAGEIAYRRDGDIAVAWSDGTNLVNVTSNTDMSVSSPGWSPGGAAIAFVGATEGQSDIYTVQYFGTHTIERLTDDPANDLDPDWRSGPSAGPGDVSCDGVVNAVDAALVLQLTSGLIDFTACAYKMDVNGDGRVDSVDAALILQFSVGLIDTLPP